MKNFLIGVLLVAVIILGYLAFKPKTEVVSPVSVNPFGQTTTINNQNGKDYQPNNGATIKDTDLGISFSVKNGAVAAKGAARCCPGTYTIVPANTNEQAENLERVVAGSTDDPRSGWAIAKSLGTKSFSTNTFTIYQITDSDSSISYIFSITKGNWTYIIRSPFATPKYIDLDSLNIY